ncbi:zinc finger CCCH domain-containing protein 3 isoform X1 [Phoenix dactylifera]|uniref:Zinc finger CCCH domain-containing protein 3 isoform X1 n=1 Tax=Phoenix dactylifera TaxID=42345 RepID=A0A8B7C7A7_PHODC|nr:zinc finger CCCH domain-containing protein 3 isoform X1 [Phoenix dactylifera]
MPLGKYYCDYCDKQFQDTPSARRRHLQGLQHQRARALWYDSFKAAEAHGGGPLLQPDGSLAKGVCHHFVRTGTCKYGDACKYFHPKRDGANPTPAVSGLNFVETVQSPNFLGNRILSGDMVLDHTGVSWGKLPPSLRPPPERGYSPLAFVDWG